MVRDIGKRGQIFSGILVLITLLMCALFIGIYMKQQGAVQSSLVSPLAVLEVRDNLTVFEMRERDLILESLDSVSSDFGSDEFLREFRAKFISGIDSDMKFFIFSNLFREGKMVGDDVLVDNFLENIVYSDEPNYVDSSEMRFKRDEIGKAFELKALKMEDTNFVVDFEFNFSAEYSIKKVGGKFLVERV